MWTRTLWNSRFLAVAVPKDLFLIFIGAVEPPRLFPVGVTLGWYFLGIWILFSAFPQGKPSMRLVPSARAPGKCAVVEHPHLDPGARSSPMGGAEGREKLSFPPAFPLECSSPLLRRLMMVPWAVGWGEEREKLDSHFLSVPMDFPAIMCLEIWII